MPLMPGGQRGQALVGVMIVMLILFALAGAVAIGASTLLSNRGQSRATTADFQVRSAVSDSVAQIAGSTQRCGAPPPPPSPGPTPVPTPTATPLTLSLPPNGASPLAFCVREDAVVPGTLHNQQVGGVSGCATFDLGRSSTIRLAVLFDVRTASPGWAYLDTQSGSAACSWPLSVSAPGPPCSKSFGTSTAPVVQVALSCALDNGEDAYLHVDLADPSLNLVFIAQQNPGGSSSTVGSLYLLASGTGLSSPDYEESILFVSGDLTIDRLLYEAPLP